MQDNSLDPVVNTDVVDGIEERSVKNALDIIQNNYKEKSRQDSYNRSIQTLFENGFQVRSPKGTRKISSKMLYQAIWRTQNRMKRLDFAIHGANRPPEMEKIVTAAVGQVMDKGNYVTSLRDKNGMFNKMLMYGDAFDLVGANPGNGSPILFTPISNTNVYVNYQANGFRSQGWGRNVNKAVVIFSYTWAEFISIWPEMEDKAGLGTIPRENDEQRELEKRFHDTEESEDLIEVAFAYDINEGTDETPNLTIFAGGGCTVIEELSGKDYPFKMDDKPYIPVLHFMGMPSTEGFYNHGIGDMVYELALISERLMNMEVGHIEDNTYPIELVSVPEGEAGKFFGKLKLAHEMRAQGKKGFVAMEYDSSNPGGNAVRSQTLLTQNLFNEWQAVFAKLDQELRRMGIVLDEVERGSNTTATQVLAEEENANSFVKQIMEYNASESKFAVELTLDFIKEFIKTSDSTPLNLTTTFEAEDGREVRADGVTMGEVADELRKHHYFVRINARTGAIPTNTLLAAQISRGLEIAPPGSPAQGKLFKQFSDLHDLDLNMKDFFPEPQAEPQRGATPDVEGEPVASETERGNINARVAANSVI